MLPSTILKKRMMLQEKKESENSTGMSFKISALNNGKSLFKQVTQMQTKSRASLIERPGLQSRARALSTISDYEEPKIKIKQEMTTSLQTEVQRKPNLMHSKGLSSNKQRASMAIKT